MKTCLLELKVKDTEAIDWKKGLISYLRRSYGSGQWSQFYDQKVADEFDRLRHNANGELAPEALLEQNLLYYAYLEHLHLRLGKNSGQLKLEFTWYDAEYGAYHKSQKYSQRTLVLEKSCTIFNIGTLYTQVAKENLGDDEKKSISCLSKAAGCFEFLSENFLNSPSVDLFSDNTSFLENVCHSEGQEIFLIKLLNAPDPSKQASLISKIAYATVRLYEECTDFYKNSNEGSSSSPTYGELKWRYIIDCKCNFYKSVTSYYYGVTLEQQGKFGESIAYVKAASSFLVQSLTHKIYLKDFIDFQGFKEQIDEKEKQLLKDNDYIYHDAIPQTVQLEVIKPMDAVKCTKWPGQIEPYMQQVAHKCESLYKGIVPLEIYEKESIYSERKADLVRQQMNANETADWEYSSFLEFTNLPKLIADFNQKIKSGFQNQDDPELDRMKENLTFWATTIQGSKFNNIDDQMKHIVQRRQLILSALAKVPDHQKDNILRMKTSLIEASQSDERLFSLVRPYTEEIKLLSSDVLLWKKFDSFPVRTSNEPSLLDLDDSKSEKVAGLLSSIRQHAEDLRLLKEERTRNLDELKDETSKDDITNILLVNSANSDSETESLFLSELEKFKPFCARIEAAVFKQAKLINEVKKEIDEIFKLSGVQEKSEEELKTVEARRRFVGKLQEAFNNYSIFCSELPKGLSFYDSLLKMTENLLLRRESDTQGSMAPQQVFQVTSKLAEMDISNGPISPPVVPPRTYGANPPIGSNLTRSSFSGSKNAGFAPPLPPKNAPLNFDDQNAIRKDLQTEERELQQNPTSFYNRPSVFDENLYSKFSG